MYSIMLGNRSVDLRLRSSMHHAERLRGAEGLTVATDFSENKRYDSFQCIRVRGLCAQPSSAFFETS